MEIGQELQDILDDYFKESEYKIVEIIFRGEKRTKVLEIFVDNKDGVRIDDLAKINKDLNALVDSKLEMNDISNIMVSSPGTERPVKYLWQLHKHLNRKIEIQLNNDEMIEGTLVGIPRDNKDEGNIMIDVQSKEKGKKVISELREINFKDIKELKIKISFSKK